MLLVVDEPHIGEQYRFAGRTGPIVIFPHAGQTGGLRLPVHTVITAACYVVKPVDYRRRAETYHGSQRAEVNMIFRPSRFQQRIKNRREVEKEADAFVLHEFRCRFRSEIY